YKIDLLAKQSGTIAHIEADHIGEAAAMLGAGRLTKDSEIDLSVGIVLHKKVGDEVSKGESLLTIYTNKQHIPSIQKKLYDSIEVSQKTVQALPLIYEIITTPSKYKRGSNKPLKIKKKEFS